MVAGVCKHGGSNEAKKLNTVNYLARLTLKRIRFNMDAIGVCASSLCMIHCLAVPLILGSLPLWRSAATGGDSEERPGPQASPMVCCEDRACCPPSEIVSEATIVASDTAACCSTPTDFWIHVGLFATVAPLGAVSWGAGFHQHRRSGVLCLGIVGVLLLAVALMVGTQLLGGRGEQVLTVFGSICMMSAHLWNRRQCQCCRKPDLAQLVKVESVTPENNHCP